MDVAASSRLGAASYAALFTLAREMLAGGFGVVLESNFRRGVSESHLVSVSAAANAVHLVHCTCSERLVGMRYRARSRHPAHVDGHRHDALRADLAAGRYEPLNVNWPTVVVHTDSGYDPPLDEVTSFVGGAKSR
jgi:predicted kinase